MNEYFEKDVDTVENLLKPFANIDYGYSNDINDRSFMGGIVNGKYADICQINITADIKSKETLMNSVNKDDVFSPLENIYYSYETELENGGIRSYEDFEAVMLNDQSMLKELGIESWAISQIMELYNKIDDKGSDYLNVTVHLAIPLKDYESVFGYNFRHVNKDEDDLITQLEDFDLYAIGDIYASYSGNDENIFYGKGDFMKEEFVGTVAKHDIKSYVADCLKYYNLK